MDAAAVLGVKPDASAEEIRAAYLSKVKEFPPERDPEQFEKIRDAFAALNDPRRRVRERLFSTDFARPLSALIDDQRPQRRFVGPRLWREALKSK